MKLRKMCKFWCLGLIFILIMGMSFAEVVDDTMVEDLGEPIDTLEDITYYGEIDKDNPRKEGILTSVSNFFSRIFSVQVLSFAQSDKKVSDIGSKCTGTRVSSNKYIIRKGGFSNELIEGTKNYKTMRAGAKCNVGEYINFKYRKQGETGWTSIFADLWKKTSSNDFMYYNHDKWSREGIFDQKGTDVLEAYYLCYVCPEVERFTYSCSGGNVAVSDPFVGDFKCASNKCSKISVETGEALRKTEVINKMCVPVTAILGCTMEEAINYYQEATADDGSCVFYTDVYGCTDKSAINYNPSVDSNDGSCEYEAEEELVEELFSEIDVEIITEDDDITIIEMIEEIEEESKKQERPLSEKILDYNTTEGLVFYTVTILLLISSLVFFFLNTKKKSKMRKK